MSVANAFNIVVVVHGQEGVQAQIHVGIFRAEDRSTQGEHRDNWNIGQSVGQGSLGGDQVVLAIFHLDFRDASLVLVFVTDAFNT